MIAIFTSQIGPDCIRINLRGPKSPQKFCGDYGTARVPPPYVVIDEVQVVSQCDGHGASSPLGQPGVGLVQLW